MSVSSPKSDLVFIEPKQVRKIVQSRKLQRPKQPWNSKVHIVVNNKSEVEDAEIEDEEPEEIIYADVIDKSLDKPATFKKSGSKNKKSKVSSSSPDEPVNEIIEDKPSKSSPISSVTKAATSPSKGASLTNSKSPVSKGKRPTYEKKSDKQLKQDVTKITRFTNWLANLFAGPGKINKTETKNLVESVSNGDYSDAEESLVKHGASPEQLLVVSDELQNVLLENKDLVSASPLPARTKSSLINNIVMALASAAAISALVYLGYHSSDTSIKSDGFLIPVGPVVDKTTKSMFQHRQDVIEARRGRLIVPNIQITGKNRQNFRLSAEEQERELITLAYIEQLKLDRQVHDLAISYAEQLNLSKKNTETFFDTFFSFFHTTT